MAHLHTSPTLHLEIIAPSASTPAEHLLVQPLPSRLLAQPSSISLTSLLLAPLGELNPALPASMEDQMHSSTPPINGAFSNPALPAKETLAGSAMEPPDPTKLVKLLVKPVAAAPHPVAAAPHPVAAAPSPVAAAPNPVAAAPNSAAVAALPHPAPSPPTAAAAAAAGRLPAAIIAVAAAAAVPAKAVARHPDAELPPVSSANIPGTLPFGYHSFALHTAVEKGDFAGLNELIKVNTVGDVTGMQWGAGETSSRGFRIIR